MDILTYDQVDPLDVLSLNLLSLEYSLTPERVALIRRLDRRPFPFFALYTTINGIVASQVGVYRLPMISMSGPEEVGSVCAVCTHPAFSQQGIAARLLNEAHARMREAGLRFSTLGTSRHRAAYGMYRKAGYEDTITTPVTFARRADVKLDTYLSAKQAGGGDLGQVDNFFTRVAAGYLGFAYRHPGFLAMMAATGDLSADDLWILRADASLVGYAVAHFLSRP
jgi:ribosomal protein S18 acetylase RimI-like enzyme